MAESTSVADSAPVSGDDIERAEQFAREPFVLEGEAPEAALAPGTARRAALDAALAEIAGGAESPSPEWRRTWSLILGLERVLSDEEPKLVDGTTLSAHQVDALSGTLIALTAEVQAVEAAKGASANGKAAADGAGPDDPVEELPSGEVELEGDDEIADDDEPLDWDEREEAEEEAASDAIADDPGAARRFWFEHATGAGKTVAALGFVEASRTGGVLILTHRRNLVDQFNGELTDRGYKKRDLAAAARQGQAARRGPGDRRDLPVVRAQRRQDLRRLHRRDLRRGAHRARREDERLDPQVGRARSSSA